MSDSSLPSLEPPSPLGEGQGGGDFTLVITGFMGTGKTTVGQAVARLLKRPFTDTDTVIEQRAGKPIPAIFSEDGEAAFRQMERQLADEIAGSRGLVVATGGGMLVDEGVRNTLLESCFVVCLDSPPEMIERRLQRGHYRPLTGEWRARYEARQAAYAAIPLHVESIAPPEQVAQKVVELWQNSSG